MPRFCLSLLDFAICAVLAPFSLGLRSRYMTTYFKLYLLLLVVTWAYSAIIMFVCLFIESCRGNHMPIHEHQVNNEVRPRNQVNNEVRL